MASTPIRVMAVDDHPIVRSGLAAVIAEEPDLAFVAQAGNGQEAIAMFRAARPDVTLMDLRMPVLGGVDAIRAIRSEFPEARIIALTTYEGDVDIHHALQAGAAGYLLKDMLPTEVVNAVRAVHGGKRVIPPAVAGRIAEYTPRVDLTEREREVLEYLAHGYSNSDIARAIGRTDETVKIHLKHVFAKLGVAGRTEAVMVALQRGIIHLER
jgi:DNA-binding NarL/FixJ family response regulator